MENCQITVTNECSRLASIRGISWEVTREQNARVARYRGHKNIHGKGAIYLFVYWLEKKEKISFSFPLWNLYGPWCQKCLFLSSNLEFLVLKDLTVDALKNAFSEHVLKEEIHKHLKLSYPYLQSSSMIKPQFAHVPTQFSVLWSKRRVLNSIIFSTSFFCFLSNL